MPSHKKAQKAQNKRFLVAESTDNFVGSSLGTYKNVSPVYLAIKLFTLTCKELHSNMRHHHGCRARKESGTGFARTTRGAEARLAAGDQSTPRGHEQSQNSLRRHARNTRTSPRHV